VAQVKRSCSREDLREQTKDEISNYSTPLPGQRRVRIRPRQGVLHKDVTSSRSARRVAGRHHPVPFALGPGQEPADASALELVLDRWCRTTGSARTGRSVPATASDEVGVRPNDAGSNLPAGERAAGHGITRTRSRRGPHRRHHDQSAYQRTRRRVNASRRASPPTCATRDSSITFRRSRLSRRQHRVRLRRFGRPGSLHSRSVRRAPRTPRTTSAGTHFDGSSPQRSRAPRWPIGGVTRRLHVLRRDHSVNTSSTTWPIRSARRT